jgi:hypothetical protein
MVLLGGIEDQASRMQAALKDACDGRHVNSGIDHITALARLTDVCTNVGAAITCAIHVLNTCTASDKVIIANKDIYHTLGID